MTRVKIAEFGIINTNLKNAVVTFYTTNADGSSTGTKATLYQASTGTASRENPQTLTAEGKLSADCYIESAVVAAVSGINDRTTRSLKKIQQNPTEYQLPITSSNFISNNIVAAVQSVNGQAGTVVIDADDIDDTSTTNKFTTAAEISKLAGIEAGADVTDTANVTTAGALMDSEVASLSGVKTLTVPDNTTISAFGATLIDDTNAASALSTLGISSATTSTQGLVEKATQSEIEAETADKYPDSASLIYSPGVAKAWGRIDKGGGTSVLDAGYNVSSVDDIATGRVRANTSVTFSAITHMAPALSRYVAQGNTAIVNEDATTGRTTTSIGFYMYSSGNVDGEFTFSLFGDLA